MKNKKADEYVLFLNYDPCMPQGERFKNAFLRGYGECQNEYEEKLRWIPISEKEPPLNEWINLQDEDGCILAFNFDSAFERIEFLRSSPTKCWRLIS